MDIPEKISAEIINLLKNFSRKNFHPVIRLFLKTNPEMRFAAGFMTIAAFTTLYFRKIVPIK